MLGMQIILKHMNKSNHNYFDFAVGSIVLGVATLFFFTSLQKSKISNHNGYNLIAKFESADGLSSGSDVKISGVKIGSVVSQELDNKTFQAVVTIKLNNDVKIPTDSSAKVASEGLLGSKYISIVPGGDTEFLAQNQEITFTQSSVNFEELLGKFIFGGNKNANN